jgi:hypothetical protein
MKNRSSAGSDSEELLQFAEAEALEIDRLRDLVSSLIAWIQQFDDDAGMMRALRRFHVEGEKIAAALGPDQPAPAPADGTVVRVDFRRRVFSERVAALERRLRGVPEVDLAGDNAAGVEMCDRLVAAKLSAREREFITSLRRQILAHPTTFELSEKQAKWLRDIWWREVGNAG